MRPLLGSLVAVAFISTMFSTAYTAPTNEETISKVDTIAQDLKPPPLELPLGPPNATATGFVPYNIIKSAGVVACKPGEMRDRNNVCRAVE